jgi:prepilin-type processing-associated H-X9-DG protein
MLSSRVWVLIVGFCVLLPCRPAAAQPLADRVPSDALLYIGWAGSERLAPAFQQSHLKGLLDSSSIPQLFSELGPRIVRRVQLEGMMEGEPLAREVLPALLALGETTWRRPTALYVGPMDYSGKAPMPRVAILCEAGKDAQGLVDTANKLAAQVPANVPVKVRVQHWPGDVVVVSNFELTPQFGESLSQRDQFKDAVKQGRPEAAFTAFFDAEKVLNVASLAINAAADAKTKQRWQRFLLASGIAGVKRLLLTSGFDGKDWGMQAFVDAPQPRMGLLAALLDSKAVSDDVLKLAPRSSNWVATTRFDLAGVLKLVRNVAAQVDPNVSKQVEEVYREVSTAVGMDLQKDVLGALGDEWVAFNSEETGRGILGMVVASPLRDAAQAEKALVSLERQLNAAMKQNINDEGPTIAFETAKVGDLTIHYFAIPAVAPCWAIKNGRLYVALYPQILAAAAEHDPASAPSILANSEFVAARKRLGLADNGTSLSYMDLPKLAPRGYQMVLALQRSALGAADLFGLQTPALALPPLNKIMPHLSTSVGATWVDEAGWHYRSATPFPGADLLGGEQAVITTVAPAAVAVGVPAAATARQRAQMVQSSSNLRQVGVAVQLYANEHQNDLPPDLGTTYSYLGSPAVYVAPQRAGAVQFPAGKPEEIAKWVNENSDYVYVGKALGKYTQILNAPQTVLAHEKFELANNERVYVLYADGHVEFTPVAITKDRIEEQNQMAKKAK